MNYIIFFVLLGAVQSLRGDKFTTEKADFLVSVREYPLMIHKCTASFIKEDVLVTTATCLLCEGYCTLFVQAMTNRSLINAKESLYSIKYTIIHPEYEMYPHKNDIGLIVLTEVAYDAVVFNLPDGYFEASGVQANIYSWQLSEKEKDFHLQRHQAKGISNMMCSLMLNQYIDDTKVCVLGKHMFLLGSYDQGSPLLGKFGDAWFILGLYVKRGIYRKVKIEIFQSVVPHIDWINEELKILDEVDSFEKDDPSSNDEEDAFYESNTDSYISYAMRNSNLRKNNMFSLQSKPTIPPIPPISAKVIKNVTPQNFTVIPNSSQFRSPMNNSESFYYLPTRQGSLVNISFNAKNNNGSSV